MAEDTRYKVLHPNPGLICPVCSRLLNGPVIISCCSNMFCRGCAEELNSSWKPCPVCLSKHIFPLGNPPKLVLEMLNKLEVQCNACDVKFNCEFITNHYEKECPSKCGHCDALLAGNISRKAHMKECPVMEVECQASSIGCPIKTQRMNIESHELQCSFVHVLPLLKQKDEEINKLKETVERLKNEQKPPFPVGATTTTTTPVLTFVTATTIPTKSNTTVPTTTGINQFKLGFTAAPTKSNTTVPTIFFGEKRDRESNEPLVTNTAPSIFSFGNPPSTRASVSIRHPVPFSFGAKKESPPKASFSFGTPKSEQTALFPCFERPKQASPPFRAATPIQTPSFSFGSHHNQDSHSQAFNFSTTPASTSSIQGITQAMPPHNTAPNQNSHFSFGPTTPLSNSTCPTTESFGSFAIPTTGFTFGNTEPVNSVTSFSRGPLSYTEVRESAVLPSVYYLHSCAMEQNKSLNSDMLRWQYYQNSSIPISHIQSDTWTRSASQENQFNLTPRPKSFSFSSSFPHDKAPALNFETSDEAYSREELEELSVPQLKEICSDFNLEVNDDLSKDSLIDLILAVEMPDKDV